MKEEIIDSEIKKTKDVLENNRLNSFERRNLLLYLRDCLVRKRNEECQTPKI